MLPNEILDTVLKFIYMGDGMQFEVNQRDFKLEDIREKLNRESIMTFLEDESKPVLLADNVELMEILEKLSKDGYLRQISYINGPTTFHTTFEGRWFIRHQNGYVGKFAVLDAEKQKTETDTLLSLHNGQRLNWLTLFLVLATLGLLFYQVWHDSSPLFSISFWTAIAVFLFGIIAGIIIYQIILSLLRRKE